MDPVEISLIAIVVTLVIGLTAWWYVASGQVGTFHEGRRVLQEFANAHGGEFVYDSAVGDEVPEAILVMKSEELEWKFCCSDAACYWRFDWPRSIQQFLVQSRGWQTWFRDNVFLLQEAATGDPDFDRAFRIERNKSSKLGEVVGQDEWRRLIGELDAVLPGGLLAWNASDGYWSVSIRGFPRNLAEFEKCTQLVIELYRRSCNFIPEKAEISADPLRAEVPKRDTR